MSTTATQSKVKLNISTTLQNPKMSVKPKIRLSFEGENLTLNYDLDNFSFKDFDYFVRQRFQIEQDAGLKYSQDFEGKSLQCVKQGYIPRGNVR